MSHLLHKESRFRINQKKKLIIIAIYTIYLCKYICLTLLAPARSHLYRRAHIRIQTPAPALAPAGPCPCLHSHPHPHSHSHAGACTRTHTRTPVPTHAPVPALAARLFPCPHTHAHARTPARSHLHLHACTRTGTPVLSHPRLRLRIGPHLCPHPRTLALYEHPHTTLAPVPHIHIRTHATCARICI